MPRSEEHSLWQVAKEKTGLNITPQRLREWFCSEMLPLGVPDSYIDAFCAHVPKSILARHHTDFSPDRLKQIYEHASLKCLTNGEYAMFTMTVVKQSSSYGQDMTKVNEKA